MMHGLRSKILLKVNEATDGDAQGVAIDEALVATESEEKEANNPRADRSPPRDTVARRAARPRCCARCESRRDDSLPV